MEHPVRLGYNSYRRGILTGKDPKMNKEEVI